MHRIVVPVPQNGDRAWKRALVIVSVALGMVALMGGLARAFYVTRTEYTTDRITQAVVRENTRLTLERLDRTLTAQTAAFEKLSDQVQDVKSDLGKKDVDRRRRAHVE